MMILRDCPESGRANLSGRRPWRLVKVQNLFSLREGGSFRQMWFLLGLIFSSFISTFIAVFLGAPWLIAIWLGLMILFVVVSRRGVKVDMQPLWRRANSEVQLLRA